MPQKIPTYIINLDRRKDRRRFITKEFKPYPEFDIHFFKAIEDLIPAVGLYKSLFAIVEIAKRESLPFVVVCEDDHCFTPAYNGRDFVKLVDRLRLYGADMLLGGVSWFEYSVKVDEELYWVNTFTGTQFLVIYANFYDRILESTFLEHDIIDRWMANLSDRIFVKVPMLSVQEDFGYSDVTDKNNISGKVRDLFLSTTMRWQSLSEINSYIQRLSTPVSRSNRDDYGQIQLQTYIICGENQVKDRRSILSQFADRMEFSLHHVYLRDDVEQVQRRWEAIRFIIQSAYDSEEDVVLICEEDHAFSTAYDKEILFDSIFQGASLKADIILGGIDQSRQPIVVNDNLCWIDSFQSMPFLIVYNCFFKKILEYDMIEGVNADRIISNLTANKYVIHPFISYKYDFDQYLFSNKEMRDNTFAKFQICSDRLSLVREKYRQFLTGINLE